MNSCWGVLLGIGDTEYTKQAAASGRVALQAYIGRLVVCCFKVQSCGVVVTTRTQAAERSA